MNKKSKCVFVRSEEINTTLQNEPTQGAKLLEPLKTLAIETNLPFKVLEDSEITNDAEIHWHEGDLWYCLEGEVIFTYGGELINHWVEKNQNGTPNENEWKAKEIKDGTTEILKPGDWLWIPAGEPHQHGCDKTARLIIIKIPSQ